MPAGPRSRLVIPASLAVIACDLPERRRTSAVGPWTAALAVALASGPVVGGYLTDRWGWACVFLLNLPFRAMAALLALAVPAAAPRRRPRLLSALDLPGVLLSGAALYFLTHGLIEGGTQGFGSAPALASLTTAGITGLAFIAVEARTFLPLVDLTTFRSRSFSGGISAQVMWGTG
ncbi:MFS transporter [Streptomyces sp. NPDC019443]|uniref:MFS transporter n=1 Tax=Streptomyces sp. NPDC019443 TaxID=3365061 RepID=UPI0037BA633C